MKITGHTKVYGILADPIHHVKTPEAMHLVFARHGVDGVLVPIHVSPDGLAEMMAGLRQMRNFGGFIATVPHKPAMVELCDEVDAHARLASHCLDRKQGVRKVCWDETKHRPWWCSDILPPVADGSVHKAPSAALRESYGRLSVPHQIIGWIASGRLCRPAGSEYDEKESAYGSHYHTS